MNFKRNVGATSEAIRMCSPKNIDEWRAYYYANVRPEAHIEELGRKLYVKISEVVQSELESITEQDCIDYMKQMVIERTYDGYTTEIQTIYGQLQKVLGVPISPAPDEWDRLFNVDFYIEVNGKYIGLQIKPVKTGMQLPEIFKEYDIQADTHKHFPEVWGGKVFYLFSQKSDKGKEIVNKDVIAEISTEIQHLNSI